MPFTDHDAPKKLACRIRILSCPCREGEEKSNSRLQHARMIIKLENALRITVRRFLKASLNGPHPAGYRFNGTTGEGLLPPHSADRKAVKNRERLKRLSRFVYAPQLFAPGGRASRWPCRSRVGVHGPCGVVRFEGTHRAYGSARFLRRLRKMSEASSPAQDADLLVILIPPAAARSGSTSGRRDRRGRLSPAGYAVKRESRTGSAATSYTTSAACRRGSRTPRRTILIDRFHGSGEGERIGECRRTADVIGRQQSVRRRRARSSSATRQSICTQTSSDRHSA